MTCDECDGESGVYDLRKPCCAARHIELETREQAARLIAHLSAKYGHDADQLRAEVVKRRRALRKDSGEIAPR